MIALRIVLVDDNEPIRRLLRTLLADAGHIVVAEAVHGRDGVRQTVAARPDLVIMDWRMPVLDGVAATREIHARCPGVPVLAFSSAGDPSVRDAFLAAGAAAYIDKADVDGLLMAIDALASRSRGDTPADRAAHGTTANHESLTLHVRGWPALGRVHITTHGALRGHATDRVLGVVAEHAHADGTIILDLSGITAIDEHAAAALHECRRLAEARGAELAFQDPSPVARRALRTGPS